jgi:hypothetical protein
VATAEKELRKRLKNLPVLGRPGFLVEPVILDYPPYGHRVHSRQVSINGHRCAIRHAIRPASVIRNFGKLWVRIKPFASTAANLAVKFVLYRLPPECPVKGWLIVPAAEVPGYPLSINLASGPKDTPVARSTYKGRWRKYLNAWEQLKVTADPAEDDGDSRPGAEKAAEPLNALPPPQAGGF